MYGSYTRLVETHFHFSILQSLPEQQRTIDDTTAFMPSMSSYIVFFLLQYSHTKAATVVTEPDKSRAVFVHAREDCPPVRLPEYVLMVIHDFIIVTIYGAVLRSGDPLEMKKDQIVLTPYIVIEQLLLRGEVELV